METKFVNKCKVIQTFIDERNSESSVLVTCGNSQPFLVFDSHNRRIKDHSNCLMKIEYLGSQQVRLAKSKQEKFEIKSVEWEFGKKIPKIGLAIGKVLELNTTNNCDRLIVDIGGIYVFADNLPKGKFKKNDFVEFGTIDFGAVENL